MRRVSSFLHLPKSRPRPCYPHSKAKRSEESLVKDDGDLQYSEDSDDDEDDPHPDDEDEDDHPDENDLQATAASSWSHPWSHTAWPLLVV